MENTPLSLRRHILNKYTEEELQYSWKLYTAGWDGISIPRTTGGSAGGHRGPIFDLAIILNGLFPNHSVDSWAMRLDDYRREIRFNLGYSKARCSNRAVREMVSASMAPAEQAEKLIQVKLEAQRTGQAKFRNDCISLYGYVCKTCNFSDPDKPWRFQADHIIPWSKTRDNDARSNGQILCVMCHADKTHHDMLGLRHDRNRLEALSQEAASPAEAGPRVRFEARHAPDLVPRG